LFDKKVDMEIIPDEKISLISKFLKSIPKHRKVKYFLKRFSLMIEKDICRNWSHLGYEKL
jgi:hypothetical protein